MARGGRDSLVDQLEVLSRLMKTGGVEVSIADLLTDGGPSRDALDDHLKRLARKLPDLVSSRKTAAGWRYRFHWPHEARVTPSGVLAIRLADRLLASFGDTAIGDELKALVLSMEGRARDGEGIPPDLSRLIFAKSRMFNPLGVAPSLLEQIATAAIRSRMIEFDYTTWSGRTPRLLVGPWTVVFADEGIYLYGNVRDSTVEKYLGTRRIFNVVRIRILNASAGSFVYPQVEQYDPRKVFAHSIGVFVREDEQVDAEEVIVHFNRRWEPYLAHHRWHESQTAPLAINDEVVEVRFRLLITQELSRWLRGFGRDVVVAAPPQLKLWVESGEDP